MITVTAYNAERSFCQNIQDIGELESILATWPTVWIKVTDLDNPEVLKLITHAFNIHKLALEDVLTKQQRAKIEQYGDIFFIIVHELISTICNSISVNNVTANNLSLLQEKEKQTEAALDELIGKTKKKIAAAKKTEEEEEDNNIKGRQLCFFLGKNYVVSFQLEELESLKQVSERIGSNSGAIRSQGADYLASAMLDTVVDTYFPVLEDLGERLEDLEDAILEDPSRKVIGDIHKIKRQLLTVRRTIWPVREVVNNFLRDNALSLSSESRLHLRDCYDHAVELIDLNETYRELGADLMDVYLSSISNRLNEVMKVLTIMAAIVAPPTLIAAIYGMNFNPNTSPYNMPELNWYFGYPLALTTMVLGSLAVVVFLWWKGWLGAMGKGSDGK